MFGRKKDTKADAKKGGGGGEALMKELGIFDMSGMENMIYGDVDNDEELEAELLALQGKQPSPKRKVKPAANVFDLDRDVAESMRDLDDEEISDTEDPELMAELEGLAEENETYEPPTKMSTPPKPEPQKSDTNITKMLQERLDMYKAAMDNANTAGESSKARRMKRGISTLQDLLKKAKAGRPVNEDDIPPPVSTSSKSPTDSENQTILDKPAVKPRAVTPPVQQTFEPTLAPTLAPTKREEPAPKPEPPKRQESVSRSITYAGPPPNMNPDDVEIHKMLSIRRDQYRITAVRSKKAGDADNARKLAKTSKQFQMVITALEGGQPVDLSKMPPPPPGFESSTTLPPRTVIERSSMQASAPPEPEPVIEAPPMTDEDKNKLFDAPKAPNNIMEALQQRLEKYKSAEAAAKEEGNGSKARRMGRIVKQYQGAIKSYNAGKPVDFEELPTPPGFAPIPVAGPPPQEKEPPKLAAPPQPDRRSVSPSGQAGAQAQPSKSPNQAQGGRPPAPARQSSVLSRAEQQAKFLQTRQAEYKEAAKQAKMRGDLELAKNHLRYYKGFDQMIQAVQSGLPVDMGQVPPSPFEKSAKSLEFVDKEQPTGDREEVYKRLQQDLIQEIRTCSTNADHFTKLGDVGTAAKFDKLKKDAMRDLDTLKNAYKHGDPVPRFHYETKKFSMLKSNPDLGDNDLELTIVRGINFSLPSGYKEEDMTTYVKYEFPYPKDEPQQGESDSQKHTIHPEYNQSFKIEIKRDRAFTRILQSKTKTLNCEVFYKRGFFKSDKSLGTAVVKLQPLESQCVLHDSYDLQEGRKTVGGKLEIKIRIRNPIVSKQIEEVEERWLVIESFARTLRPEVKGKSSRTKDIQGTNQTMSMEVLKYEKQLLDREIQNLKGKLSESEEMALKHKSQLLEQRVNEQKDKIRKGGIPAYKAYADAIEPLTQSYNAEAQGLLKDGLRDKAQILLNKKTYVEREVASIRSKLPS